MSSSTHDTFNPANSPKQRAVLVGIQTPKLSDHELKSSLEELERLVTTLGYQVVGKLSQKRSSEKSASVFGEGKLEELARWTGGSGKINISFQAKKHKASLRFTKVDGGGSEDIADEDITDEDDDIEYEPIDNEDDAYVVFGEDGIHSSLSLDSTVSDSVVTNSKLTGTNEPKETKSQPEPPAEPVQIVIVDSELSPSQLRNLESAVGVKVLDRTGVIIEIFSRHAKTREAKLQVEIARLKYVAPRLRETGTQDKQEGGGGKGAGETGIELDRRNIRDRIKELKEELAAIGNTLQQRRSRRKQESTVALVGYTNAGKSSLMRALTGSEVYVADKLFATLDTTVRALHPESTPKVLVSDTVGFIKKLPHDLVASFRSTLDEAASASLLLFVVDSSDPSFRDQLAVTREVLEEVGASDLPQLLILNKRDKITTEEFNSLKEEFADGIFLSTRNPEDVKALREKILSYFESDMTDEDLFIPYKVQGLIGEIRSRMRVLSENYTNDGLKLSVRAKTQDLDRVKKMLAQQIEELF